MRVLGLFALSSVSLVALSAPAFAQATSNTESGDSLTGNEIVVSARRREESLQDVPLVVNAVTSESIQKLNIREGTEVQALVPGLQLRNEANGIGAAAQLRGLQFDINASSGRSVEFYLNDAVIDAGSVLQALYDIGQVEVLRGPQGTLRGTATPSGSITFTTRKPNLDQAGATLQGTVNDIGLFNLNGAINVPIIENVLGIRVAGVHERTRANRVHSIDPDADLRNPYAETNSGRVSVTFQPTDWLKLEGMYQTMERESRFYDQYASFGLVDPTAPASAVVIRPRDRLSIEENARSVDQHFEVYNWRGEVRYGGQVLIYQGSRSNLDFTAQTNQDAANFLNRRDVFQNSHVRSALTSHEVRLQSEQRVLGLFDYVVGYYHTDNIAPTTLTTETPVVLPSFLGGGLAAVAQTPIRSDGAVKENAVFGNVTLHLGEATQISGGLRYLNVKAPPSFLVIGANTIPTAAAIDDKKVIYTASIQHNFTPDLMVYASTGSSRRYGPTIVNPAVIVSSPLMRSFIDLDSEDSHSYEIGVKSSWLDNRLTFNLTGFYQKFKNYPYKLSTPIFFQQFSFNGTTFAPGVGSSNQFAAGVPVEIKGVEAELAWRVTNNFNFSLNAAYADGKIKNGLVPCNDLNGDSRPDVTTTAPTLGQLQAAYGTNYIGSCRLSQRSSNQSPFNATALAEYSHPVANKVDAFARGLFTFYGASKVEPTNTFDDLGSFGLLNVYAGLRSSDGTWELNFYAKNVFDVIRATKFDPPATTAYQELAPPTFQTTVGKSFTSTYSQILTTPPREFGLNLRFAFGPR